MAVNAGYVASQNKRFEEANRTGNTDMQNRLQADAKRAGYALNPYQQAVQSATSTATTPAIKPQSAPQPSVKTNLSSPVTAHNNNQITPGINTPTRETIDRFNTGTQQNFEFKGPEAFTYDYQSDPAYQAALNSARSNITSQQQDTNALLRSTGQGKSSYSETLANQIGAKEMGRISDTVIPQLAQQAYQRYADQANRNMQVQQANYGVGQDNLSNLARLYSIQDQEFFQNPMSEANMTGQYLSGEARGYINAINELKSQAENPNITRDQRAVLSSQADQYRRSLQGLGVDSTLFGADVNLDAARGNQPRAGVRTLQGQNMDEGIRQYNQNFDYGTQRDAVSDAQYQQELQRALANDANSRSLGWANLALSQQREGRIASGESSGSSSGGSSGASAKPKDYKYTDDSNFQSMAVGINSSNQNTLNDVMYDLDANSQYYIDAFGFAGYENLLKRANDKAKTLQKKEEATSPLMKAIQNGGR